MAQSNKVMNMRSALLAFACMATISQPVSAATILTFDAIPQGDTVPDQYVEGGVTVTGSPSYYENPGQIHMDDAGTFYAKVLSFSTGGIFAALGVDVFGLGQASYTETAEGDIEAIAHQNVWFRGYRGAEMVAEFGYSTGLATETSRMGLGSDFANLDRFTIAADTVLPVGAQCADAPCGHFEIDNLEIAPVPIPAAGWLLAGGLGMLLAARRRKLVP